MDLSIIIVNFNTEKLVKNAILSVVRNTRNISYEIIVVDNASSDNSRNILKKLEKNLSEVEMKVIENKKNVGFGRANNQGMKVSRGRYILLLNSDTLIHDNVLGKMVSWMDKNLDIGISTCALKGKDGKLQGPGGYFPTLLRVFSWMIIQDIPLVDKLIKPFHPVHSRFFNKGAGFFKIKQELDWVTGAFMFVRRQVYEQTGGFDRDFFMYTEDVDLCYRARARGWKIFYIPTWFITHYGGASGSSWSHVLHEFEGIKLFFRKHYPKWQYPVLRLLLKLGAFWRMILFGILSGKEAAKAYAKAFIMA